tara:strand:- start:3716 stop:4114 length:399 start_codon:yes stop_codon:yes gene_type:complete
MAPKHGNGLVTITTIHPAIPGLEVLVESQEDGTELLRGVTDSGGGFRTTYDKDELPEDTLVALVLTTEGGNELIRCRVPLRALNPMECFMTNPPKLSVDEVHKRFMAAHARAKKNGVEHPDPDLVARMANKF